MWNLKNNTIIFFYADWCGHCKTFMPTWKEFKNKINTKEYNIIEIESQNPFTQKIKRLRGYPSIFYIYLILVKYTKLIVNFRFRN